MQCEKSLIPILVLGTLLSILYCLVTHDVQDVLIPLKPQGTYAAPQGRTVTVTPQVTPQGKTVIPQPDQSPVMSRKEVLSRCGKYYEEHNATYEHPSIVHYAKLTDKSSVSLAFTNYMSMMSAYKLLRPERIIIHSYTNITGTYWDRVRNWSNVSVELNVIKRVKIIGGKKVKYLSHQADFIKLQALLQFGGVISDFDVIILNGSKIKHLQRLSQCVLSDQYESVNAGFASCIKNSSYIRSWLDTYHHDYHPSEWMYNAGNRPKQILKKNKKYHSKICLVDGIATHPAWSEALKKWLVKKGVNWQAKIVAHYFNKRLKDRNETVLEDDNSFGEMMRFINSHA